MEVKPIGINALFGDGMSPNLSQDPRKMLRDVNVILAVDVMTKNQYLVFGRKQLDRVIRTNRPKNLSVLRVELDYETDELEKLLALVEVVKGYHDYH